MARTKGKTTRQEQATQTRKKILKTAISMLETKGFDNITIEEICKKANVSVGSFYVYFKSKYDVLNYIFAKADEYFIEREAEIRGAGDAIEQILEFLRVYADYRETTSVGFLKKLYNTDNHSFLIKDRFMYQLLSSIVTQGQKEGQLTRDIGAEELVNYLFVVARGFMFDWCLHDGDYDLKIELEQFFKLFAPCLAEYPAVK